MARLILPVRFQNQAELSTKVNTKHLADGAGSILNAVIAENAIDMAADAVAVTAALASHKIFDEKGKFAEKMFGESKRLFTPVFKQHRRCVQNLKSFYAKNISKLGDFGVTVNGKKIVYPTSVTQKMDAVVTFIDYHLGLPPGTSPLTNFLAEPSNSDINLVTNRANTLIAKTNHTDGAAANTVKETKRVERDNFMTLPIADYTINGNWLMNHFSTNPNKAGDWGFIVDTSPKGTKVRTGFVNISSQKTLTSLAIGGVLINQSDFDIEGFKGKTASGTPVILKPGKPLLIEKGMGTFTLRNPNAEKKAMYQGVFNV